MVEPSELLQDLCMGWVLGEDLFVCFFSQSELLLLLVDMTNLEPDVHLSQRSWRDAENVSETVETCAVLVLLLVYDTEAKVDLVCLFVSGIHPDYAGEGLLRVLETAISIVKDPNSVPELGLLWVRQMVQGLLVSCVRPLQVIHHKIAVSHCAPRLSAFGQDIQYSLEVVDCFTEPVEGAVHASNGAESGDRVGIMAQSGVVCSKGAIEILHRFGSRTCGRGEPRVSIADDSGDRSALGRLTYQSRAMSFHSPDTVSQPQDARLARPQGERDERRMDERWELRCLQLPLQQLLRPEPPLPVPVHAAAAVAADVEPVAVDEVLRLVLQLAAGGDDGEPPRIGSQRLLCRPHSCGCHWR